MLKLSFLFPCSYDTRHGDFMGGHRWKDKNVLGERSYFIASPDPPRLVLEPVHATDQAVYTCRIDYKLSPSTTVTVNLTVVSEFPIHKCITSYFMAYIHTPVVGCFRSLLDGPPVVVQACCL